MADRLSSLDDGYVTGDLSVFPEAIDSTDELYAVRNNAETELTQSLTYNGSYLVVGDTSKFPDKGLLRVGDELMYYGEKTTGVFKDLKRGFAGSRQNSWSIGTSVGNAVMAEHHNAIKDAILNIENYLGTSDDPAEGSYNHRLTTLEAKFLSPRALFRAWPRRGSSPMKVRFQNFSTTDAIRYLWDFGDGGTSTERNPTHTYNSEGNFSVQLRIVTSLGGQCVTNKLDYIQIDNTKTPGFFYVTPEMGTTSTVFNFVDQTDGDIIVRHWNFGDGNQETFENPNIHSTTHTYSAAGAYKPSVLVVFADQSIQLVTVDYEIVVT